MWLSILDVSILIRCEYTDSMWLSILDVSILI